MEDVIDHETKVNKLSKSLRDIEIEILKQILENEPLHQSKLISFSTRNELILKGLVTKCELLEKDGFHTATTLGKDVFTKYYNSNSLDQALSRVRLLELDNHCI